MDNLERMKKPGLVILILLSLLVIFLYVSPGEEYPPAGEREVELYFATADAMYLDTESRTLPGEDLYAEAVAALIQGPETQELRATIPEEAQLIDYTYTEGEITLNFAASIRTNHPGGSTGERLTVYSIVNTLTSLPGIDQVKFQIEGADIETLVGHLDLTIAYSYSENIMADNNSDPEENEEEYQIEIEDN
ncbi:MAG: GerMN domain-containing protein [Bacillota bacterium]